VNQAFAADTVSKRQQTSTNVNIRQHGIPALDRAASSTNIVRERGNHRA
jgi:hypothetical protein